MSSLVGSSPTIDLMALTPPDTDPTVHTPAVKTPYHFPDNVDVQKSVFVYCDAVDLCRAIWTCREWLFLLLSRCRALSAWWIQLGKLVADMGDGDAFRRRLFAKKFPLLFWDDPDVFHSSCVELMGAIYNMAPTYVPDRHIFYVDLVPMEHPNIEPMSNACKYYDLPRLNILLDGGYDVNDKDHRGNALHHLARQRLDTVTPEKILVWHRVLNDINDINETDIVHYGDTALVLAARGHSHPEYIKLLMDYPGIDMNAKGTVDRTTLHWAVLQCVRYEHGPDVVALLLSDPRVDCTIEDHYGFTPYGLTTAYNRDLTECAALFVAHGVAISHGSFEKAFDAHDERSVEILLASGRNPNVRPVFYYDRWKRPYRTKYGRNALQCAAQQGCSLRLFNIILTQMNDVDAMYNDYTPLMLAARHNRRDLVESLMKCPDVNPNIQNRWNFTALHYAVHYERPDIVKLIAKCSYVLNGRVDTTLKDTYGRTPLAIARQRHNRQCIDALAVYQQLDTIG